MVIDEATGFCRQCNRQRLIRRRGTNHLLHLILTVLTGGLWLIVWILAAIKIGGWRCSGCGARTPRSLLR